MVRRASTASDERGQVLVLLVGALVAVLAGVFLLGAVARGVGRQGEAQRAADLAALGGRAGDARGVSAVVRAGGAGRVGESAASGEGGVCGACAGGGRARGRGQRCEGGAWSRSRTAGASRPCGSACRCARRVEVAGRGITLRALAEAELGAEAGGGFAHGGGYDGPLAMRQGKRMRPDVAQAFDRMAAAARADGVQLLITSAFRSDAEQAVLFARHPDPKWVARPGESLHRYGTELDLGPASAYGVAGGQRAALPLHPAVRVGGLALRLRTERRARRRAQRGRRRAGRRDAGVRAAALRAARSRRRAAVERLRDAAGRAALRGVQLQPVRGQPRGGAGHRPVHAGDGERLRPARTRSTPRRRSTRRRT